MFKLSTLMPDGSHPLTEKETAAEVGMRLALIWAFVLRGPGRGADEGAKNAGSWDGG